MTISTHLMPGGNPSIDHEQRHMGRGVAMACVLGLLLTTLGCGGTAATSTTSTTPTTPATPHVPSPTPAAKSVEATANPDSAEPADNAQIEAPEMASLGESGIEVMYLPSGVPELDFWMSVFRGMKFMEKLTLLVDSRIRLPRRLPLKVAKCGFVNAYYHRINHEVVLCHEFVVHLARLFSKQMGIDSNFESNSEKQRDELLRHVIMTTIFVMYHELGHALVGELDLPVTGKSEDVADQAAAWILLSVNTKGKLAEAVLAGADWFAAEAKTKAGRKKSYSGAHSLDEQRYFNLMCWAYGSDPVRFAAVAKKLPVKRRVRCKREFTQLERAFGFLLKSHLRSDEESKQRRELLNRLIDDKLPPSADSKQCEKAVMRGTKLSIAAYLIKLGKSGKMPSEPSERAKLSKQLLEGTKASVRNGMMLCLSGPWSTEKIACINAATDADALKACKKL